MTQRYEAAKYLQRLAHELYECAAWNYEEWLEHGDYKPYLPARMEYLRGDAAKVHEVMRIVMDDGDSFIDDDPEEQA